jgi:DNA-binding LacI/PurR family transcriptional regulator
MSAISRSSAKSYSSIATDLIERIRSGELPEGNFLPIERELMEAYGVTRTTIRRALSLVVEKGHGLLVPNKGVLPLKGMSRKAKTIGFVDGSTVVLRSLFSKLNGELLKLGHQLVHLDAQVIGLENALTFAMERNFDALFIWSFEGFPNKEAIAEAAERMPIIALDHSLWGFETDLVTLDYFNMAVEAVDYLAKSGRKRIAISGMLDMLDVTQNRFSGYLKGLFDNEMTPDVRDFAFSYTSGYGEPNYDHLAYRLAAEDRPDAIFVMQDEFLPGVVDTIFKCGLTIPDDVDVATIGDDLVVRVGNNEVTAVHCDWNGFAEQALSLLMERLQDPNGVKKRLISGHYLKPATTSTDLYGQEFSQRLVSHRRGSAAPA